MQAPKNIIPVSDSTYSSVVEQADKPVVFVMGAPWCPDCMRIAPLMGMLAEAYSDRLLFVRADFDNSPQLKEKFDVRHIPTLVIIKEGKVIDTLVEPKSIAPVKAFIEKAM